LLQPPPTVCALPKQAAEQAGSRPIERENAARGWVEKDGGRKRAAWWISASRLRRRSLLAPLLLRGSTWLLTCCSANYPYIFIFFWQLYY